MNKKISRHILNRGQSIVESVLSITIGAMVLSGVTWTFIVALSSNIKNKNSEVAQSLSQDMLDQVTSVADGGWDKIYNVPTKGSGGQYVFSQNKILAGTVSVIANTSAVAGTDTQFLTDVQPLDYLAIGNRTVQVSTVSDNTHLTLTRAYDGDTVADGDVTLELSPRVGTGQKTKGYTTFTRYFTVENVARDSCGRGNVSLSATSTCTVAGTEVVNDPLTQKISTVVQWMTGSGLQQVSSTKYITQRRETSAVFTNWNGGVRVDPSHSVSHADTQYVFMDSAITVSSTGGFISISPLLPGAQTADLISSTLDSRNAGGARATGVMWKGSLGAGGSYVRFQLATGDCENGATNYPTCDFGSWSYKGPDGTINTYYATAGSGQRASVIAENHSGRYMRYRLQMAHDAGGESPVVDSVFLFYTQ